MGRNTYRFFFSKREKKRWTPIYHGDDGGLPFSFFFLVFGWYGGFLARLSLLLLEMSVPSLLVRLLCHDRRYKKGYISRYRQVASVRMVNDEDSLAPSASCAPKLSLSPSLTSTPEDVEGGRTSGGVCDVDAGSSLPVLIAPLARVEHVRVCNGAGLLLLSVPSFCVAQAGSR